MKGVGGGQEPDPLPHRPPAQGGVSAWGRGRGADKARGACPGGVPERRHWPPGGVMSPI